MFFVSVKNNIRLRMWNKPKKGRGYSGHYSKLEEKYQVELIFNLLTQKKIMGHSETLQTENFPIPQ